MLRLEKGLTPPPGARTPSLRSARRAGGTGLTLVKHEDRLEITTEADVVTARQKGRALAAAIGFSPAERAMITSAISELARNILDYAWSGEMLLGPCADGERRGIELIARDHGPGIPNVEKVMQAGYAISDNGLPAVRALMDEFNIASVFGQGTTVTTRKWRT